MGSIIALIGGVQNYCVTGRFSAITLIAGVICAFFLSVAPVQAEGLGSLISPGDLSGLHKNIEGLKNCTKCHELRGGIPDSNCLDCHKDIKRSIADKGYHSTVKTQKCISCHSDHKGRNFSLIEWKGFNHTATGYKLAGKHAKVDCSNCHTAQTKMGVTTYLGLERDCVSCHKKDDKHKNSLGPKCESCHNVSGWKKDVRFNHDKTKYPLRGKHLKAKCDQCHTKNNRGIFKVENFNSCNASGCHDVKKRGNIHGNQFKGKNCDDCHTVKGWKPSTFNHNSDSYKGFRLAGKHRSLDCGKCHKKGFLKGITYASLDSSSCNAPGCHDVKKRGNIHGNQFKDKSCDNCHTVKGWKPAGFNHNSPSYKGYKLEGKHASLKCGNCHRTGAFGKINYKPINSSTCNAPGCHDIKKRGNIHRNQFKGKSCEDCHTVNGWKPAGFNHNSPSYKGYKLEGKHASLKCSKCHRTDAFGKVKYKPIDSSTCNAPGCHDVKKRGNIHGNQFKGKQCEECHTLQGWKPTTFRHGSSGYNGYKLKGKHASLDCSKCHTKNVRGTVVYKPISSKTCNAPGCHDVKRRGNIHGNQFAGKMCENCHNFDGWKKLTFNHNKHSDFPLLGKHAATSCEKCHFGKAISKNWKPLESSCKNCHTKDDKHKGTFGTKCGECHTSVEWKPKGFDHKLSGFDLKGAHSQVACDDCHTVSGIFKGQSTECTSCHTDPHFSQFGGFCTDCHTESSWLPRRFNHNATGFRLEGVHRITACEDCHQNRNYRNVSTDCFSCHQADFFSQGAFGFHGGINTACESCHVPYAWSPATQGSHTTMTFTGVHKSIASNCDACHLPENAELRWAGVATEDQCASCHQADYFEEHSDCPQDCVLCHNTRDWDDANEAVQCR